MKPRLLTQFLRYCLLAALLAGAGGIRAQTGPGDNLSADLLLPPLSAYKNGRLLSFSQDNQYWFEFQDEQGFLWGTDQYGEAIRYDGYEVKAFPVGPVSPEGVQCTGLLKYLPDSKGRIWLAISWCGLDRFDPRAGQFEHFNDAIFAVKNASPRAYQYLFEDSRKNIWIGAQAGLYKYSIADSSFSYAAQMSHAALILEDRNGDIWAGNPITAKFLKKIDRSDIKKGERIPFPYIGDLNRIQEFHNSFRAVSPPGKDHGNLFLISVGGHLYTFDVAARAITPRLDGLLPGELIYSIFNDGITLVGADKNRVLQYDHERQEFFPFLTLPDLPGQSDPIKHIFRSKDGILWVVTQKRTFQVLPEDTPFKKVLFPPGLRQPVNFGNDESLILFRKHLYFHTDTGLQPVIEGKGNAISLEFSDEDYKFPGTKGKAGPEVDWIKKVSGFKFREDTSGDSLWLLLYQYPLGMKVFRFDKNGRKTFQHHCSGRDTCFNDNILDLDISPEGKLWMAGWAGASRFDPEKREFSNYTQRNGCLPDLVTRSILFDSRKNVWIGTNSRGLARYDTKADTFEYFFHDPSHNNSLTTDYLIHDITESRNGNIWVATGNGLNRYDYSTGRFEQFYEKDGLPFSQLINLKEDKNNSIWMTSDYHLTLYSPQRSAFYTFSPSDGIPHTSFRPKAAFEDGEGRLFFQVADGVIWFHPDSIQLDHRVPKLYFTDLKLANQSVKVNDSTGILSRSIAFTDTITLQYRQNVFSIHYSALEYLHPDKISYSFQLVGFDEGWRQVGNSRDATYTNLPPGDYLFQVKCQNRHGFPSEPIKLNITVLPPWYRTWWAYSLWAALLAGALLAFYRFQLNRRLAQAEARRLQELDAVKTRLYTNITHEFRTPLTIIQGTVGQLMSKVDYTLREELKRIQRNGRQLLNLVNQMLDLAKLESGSLPVSMQQGDVIPFLKYLLESFHSLAEAKNISLHFRSEAERLVMDYDAEKIQQIVGNLLSNGVKFTDSGGRVIMAVERCSLSVPGLPNQQPTTNNKQHKYLSISVSDTGIGIPEEKLPHVFNRFYQADDSATRRGEGTGIGLTLTKELVKLLGGKIEVESELGDGTTFTVWLPITKLADIQKQESPPAPPGFAPPLSAEVRTFDTSRKEEASLQGQMHLYTDTPIHEQPATLLIIEDNPDVTHYLSSILKNSYTLLTAPDGKAGLETAQQKIPDLILCDVMMPEMDGFEMCRRLKSDLHTSHIPIIMLTAKADIDSRIEGIEQGADAYLAKPFEERELKARLKKLLENRERLRAYYTSDGFIARKGQPPAGEGQPSPADREFFERLLAAVEDNLSDPAFSAEQLADLLFVSYATCLRKVKAFTNCTVKEYIRQIRIHRAAKLLLEEPGRSIGAIAADTGFNSNTHFTREFRKVMGCTPTAYRKQGE